MMTPIIGLSDTHAHIYRIKVTLRLSVDLSQERSRCSLNDDYDTFRSLTPQPNITATTKRRAVLE